MIRVLKDNALLSQSLYSNIMLYSDNSYFPCLSYSSMILKHAIMLHVENDTRVRLRNRLRINFLKWEQIKTLYNKVAEICTNRKYGKYQKKHYN